MPIEIRELVIRTSIVDRQANQRDISDIQALKREVMRDCMTQLRQHLDTERER